MPIWSIGDTSVLETRRYETQVVPTTISNIRFRRRPVVMGNPLISPCRSRDDPDLVGSRVDINNSHLRDVTREDRS